MNYNKDYLNDFENNDLKMKKIFEFDKDGYNYLYEQKFKNYRFF